MNNSYARKEIVSTSKASKELGKVLRDAKERGRIVLSRNNKLEAVILPVEVYEEMLEDLEHLLIALETFERKERDRGKRISLETLKAKHGL
jgi:prevent-host-death family protein